MASNQRFPEPSGTGSRLPSVPTVPPPIGGTEERGTVKTAGTDPIFEVEILASDPWRNYPRPPGSVEAAAAVAVQCGDASDGRSAQAGRRTRRVRNGAVRRGSNGPVTPVLFGRASAPETEGHVR
jgi:hypothetical protein